MVRDIAMGNPPPPVNRGGDWKSSGTGNHIAQVEVAERIVNSLMPLLDAMHDIANGISLQQGSQQRKVVEHAKASLPAQLQELLSLGNAAAQSSAVSSTVSSQDVDLDPVEARLRAEKERQEKIRQKKANMMGVPPPNVRLLEYGINSNNPQELERVPSPPEPEPEVRTPSTPVAAVVSKLSGGRKSASVGAQPQQQQQQQLPPAVVTAVAAFAEPVMPNIEVVPRGMDWRTALKTKKQREEQARREAELAAKNAEESRWAGVPAWKRALLESKAQKQAEREAPLLEAQRLEEERQARFNALPAWKQKLLLEKKN